MSQKVASGLPQPQGVSEDPLAHYTRIFVRFLQLVFASFEKGSYQWLRDDELTDILVSDQATLPGEVVEKRPAILVHRGPAMYGNISLDQFHSSDMQSGRRTHTDLVNCSMTFNVLSREGLEAQRLAYITAMATRRLKRTLMKAGPMHRVGEEINIGAESAPGALITGDENEIILVSVSIPFYFQDAWSIEPIDKVLLKDINLALTSQANDLDLGNTTGLKPPTLNGQVLQVEKSIPLSTSVRVKAGVSTPRSRK